mmetsp:Transcript_75476/g.174982  ORF Transcript_75476/g.174982 Transcript_75476/m.174982 type:complete len:344 (-) Transcript_75476:551-1582(-)
MGEPSDSQRFPDGPVGRVDELEAALGTVHILGMLVGVMLQRQLAVAFADGVWCGPLVQAQCGKVPLQSVCSLGLNLELGHRPGIRCLRRLDAQNVHDFGLELRFHELQCTHVLPDSQHRYLQVLGPSVQQPQDLPVLPHSRTCNLGVLLQLEGCVLQCLAGGPHSREHHFVICLQLRGCKPQRMAIYPHCAQHQGAVGTQFSRCLLQHLAVLQHSGCHNLGVTLQLRRSLRQNPAILAHGHQNDLTASAKLWCSKLQCPGIVLYGHKYHLWVTAESCCCILQRVTLLADCRQHNFAVCLNGLPRVGQCLSTLLHHRQHELHILQQLVLHLHQHLKLLLLVLLC